MYLAWVLFSVPSLLPVYGLVAWFRKDGRHRWVLALGWLTLWVLPAVVVQSGWVLHPDWSSVLFVVPVGLWVLLGGRSVIAGFEALMPSLAEHRGGVLLDHWYLLYVALTAIQCAIFVAILSRRGRPSLRDPLAVVVGIAFLVNAMFGVTWMWWGT